MRWEKDWTPLKKSEREMNQVSVTSGNSSSGVRTIPPRTQLTPFLKVKSQQPAKEGIFLILITTRDCFKLNKTHFSISNVQHLRRKLSGLRFALFYTLEACVRWHTLASALLIIKSHDLDGGTRSTPLFFSSRTTPFLLSEQSKTEITCFFTSPRFTSSFLIQLMRLNTSSLPPPPSKVF